MNVRFDFLKGFWIFLIKSCYCLGNYFGGINVFIYFWLMYSVGILWELSFKGLNLDIYIFKDVKKREQSVWYEDEFLIE